MPSRFRAAATAIVFLSCSEAAQQALKDHDFYSDALSEDPRGASVDHKSQHYTLNGGEQ